MKFGLITTLGLAATTLFAQQTGTGKTSLATMSSEIRRLTQHASRAVVEIEVSSYGSGSDEGTMGVLSRQQGLGSGVVIDPSGYIVTNAHVVAGAYDVKVLMNAARGAAGDQQNPRRVDARIIGADRESDLALLKIDAVGLPVLPFAPVGAVRQGDLVLAIGNPMGLRNSVSLGVVSAVSRSVNGNSPLSYIQTDASINPGNSGGALVDADGRLIGINTFILTQSGGNEGLGFAIPSNVVQDVVRQLRDKGHVDRGEVGVLLEDLTPALRDGLSLKQSRGLIVADVDPDSPADKAGLQIADLLIAVNGIRVDSVSRFRNIAYFKRPGEKLILEYLRGDEPHRAEVITRTRRPHFDPVASMASPEKNLVPRLGILGLEITPEVLKVIPALRVPSGVIVAARAQEGLGRLIDLQAGDVIHAANGTPVVTLDFLKSKVDELQPGAALALQVEREGRMQYVALEVE